MGRKSYEEQLAELKSRQDQLRARERQLKARQTTEERKKRTKRLIELGAIIESVLNRPTTEDDKEKLLKFLKTQESNGKYFTKAMNREIANEIKDENGR